MARKINFDAPIDRSPPPHEERTKSRLSARVHFSGLSARSSNPAHSARYRSRLEASRRRSSARKRSSRS